MELVLTEEDLEPLLKQKEDVITKPSGFLNSSYKNSTKLNSGKETSQSLFRMKQYVKRYQNQVSLSIATVLKISVFTIAIITIFS